MYDPLPNPFEDPPPPREETPCGPVEQAVRTDVEVMGELLGVEPSLAQTAYALAAEIDAGAGRFLAGLAKELRATLEQLAAARRGVEPSDKTTSAVLDEADEDDLGRPE